MSASEQKTEQPTPHKLREARKRGEVAISRELTGALAFLAVFLFLWLAWDGWIQRVRAVVDAALRYASRAAGEGGFDAAVQEMLASFLWVIAPVLMTAAVVALLVAGLQTRGVFSMHPLRLDFNRLNPGQSFERLFSSQQGLELLKMLLKLALLSGVLFAVVRSHLGAWIGTLHGSTAVAAHVGIQGLKQLFAFAAACFVLLGLVDYAHQFYEYIKRNRMSKSERKREHKDQEGAPELRSQLRRTQREVMESPVKPRVGMAQVLVTNPTHFSVALFYQEGVVDLPVVVAKGQDHEALALRSEARRLGVPVLERPPLARSLFRSVQPGEPIQDEHIDAVAEVFRWLASLDGRLAPHPSQHGDFR